MLEYPKIETLYKRDKETFKVDVLQVRNPAFNCIKHWVWTEKIDGMNIRVGWDSWKKSFTIYSRNGQNVPEAGLLEPIKQCLDAAKFDSLFPSTDIVVFGELFGAGIQKGKLYSDDKKFVGFDIFVHSIPPVGVWLSPFNTDQVLDQLGIIMAPYRGHMSLQEATFLVAGGFNSDFGTAAAEGLVGRPQETLHDGRGNRIIVKLKTKDF